MVSCLFITIKISAQISPGELTSAHAKYEGLSNCTKCHVLGKQVQESKCLSCHDEINRLISSGKGYHASPEVKGKECQSCHSEHHGRDFRIINFYPDKFNHSESGFKLEGKHSEIKCGECHQAKFVVNKKLFLRRQNTFLGLSTDCVSCHEDVHRGTLGRNCASCHNNEKFKPAVFFNHDSAKFKLTGAHKTVECVKCHTIQTVNGKPFEKFTGLQFKECSSCHTDVHKGMFGRNCTSCHSDESFKNVRKSSFDHNKTRFPLKGAHVKVACADCHGSNLMSKPKYAKCTDCHKDKHFGEFTEDNKLTDCAKCHSEESFKVTLYTSEEHSKIKFALTGAHLAVPCVSCHLVEKSNEWHFRNIGKRCADCHKNIHGSEISGKFMKENDCASCHSTAGWNKITFDHSETKFKLLGVHGKTGCRACHQTAGTKDNPVFKFASLNSGCTFCHKDIHFGQFIGAEDGNKTVCLNCHGFDNWKPVKFDHEKTGFPLKGAHEKVLCGACHKRTEKNGNIFIKYKMKDFKCASCHS